MKIAELFVDVLPDMGGFQSDLNRSLSNAARTAKIEVPVTADTRRTASQLNSDVDKMGKTAGHTLGGSMGGAMKSAFGIAAGLGAVTAVTGLIGGAIGEAREAQKTAEQTAAVLKSTGGAAKVSAKQVDELASAISRKTGIDDEQIAASENMLLTFTNIRNETGKGRDIFNQATQAVTDMSVATGQDAVKSSVMLGKALNDPVKGISALSRVGVTFTEQQKAQIKAMTEAGDVAGAQKVILDELAKEFGGSAEAQATAGDKARVAWGNFKEELGNAVLPMVDKLATFFTDTLLPALGKIGTYISEKVVPKLKTFWSFIKDNILPIFGAIFDFVKEKVVPAFGEFVDRVAAAKDFLIPLAAAITAVVAALVAYSAVMKVVRALTAAWTAAQVILNVVMSANPLGLVILAIVGLVAALAVVYQRSEAFREIVQKVWSAVKDAVHTAWEGTIKPALTALWEFIQNTLIPIFQKIWDVAKNVFGFIADAIKVAWENVILPIFKLWWTYITEVLIPVIQFLWEKVVKPVFSFIADAIKFAWEKVIQPALKAMKAFLDDVLIPVITFLWEKVVKPAFEGIGSTIKWVWENVIRPAFDALKSAVGLVKTAFDTAVAGIGTIWETLKGLAAKPINFIIKTVWNDGLRKALNLIPGVNIGEASPIAGYAKGGVLPGYTPGRDVHQFYSPTGGALALSGGEAIMRPEWVKRVGGPAAVERMNAAARRGVYDEFASGGIYRPTRSGSYLGDIHDQYTGFPAVDVSIPVGTPVYAGHGGTATSYDIRGNEPRVPSGGLGYKSYGRVVKIVGEGRSSLYAHLSKRIASSGSVKGGQLIGLSGNTGHSFGPHLHFGANNPGPRSYYKASTAYSGDGTTTFADGGEEDGGGHWWDKALELFRKVKDAIFNNSMVGLMNVKDMAKAIANKVVDFANSKIPLFDPIPHLANGGLVTRPTLGLIGEAGPEAVIPLSKTGLLKQGASPQQWDNLEQLLALIDGGRRTQEQRRPAVVIENYNAYENTNVEALMQSAEFYVRSGRL